MTIIQKITQLRRERGVQQYVLAPAIGLTAPQFSRLMKGKRPVYAVDLLKICRALEVDPALFLLCDEVTGIACLPEPVPETPEQKRQRLLAALDELRDYLKEGGEA